MSEVSVLWLGSHVSELSVLRLALGSSADVCANSGPQSDKEPPSGPMVHVSVSFREASGGSIFSLWGVVVLCVLPFTLERLV